MQDGRIYQTMDSRFPTCTNGETMEKQIRAALGDGAELQDVTAAEPFYIEADSPAIQACINTYNEVTGENAKPFTMGGGTYARHFPYAVSFGPEHVDPAAAGVRRPDARCQRSGTHRQAAGSREDLYHRPAAP